MREALRRFAKGSRQRFAVAQRLERIYHVAVGTGHLARFVVFGSFVSAKKEPVDVDVFLLMQDTLDRKSTRLNSSHIQKSRMPSSA